jgi:hypothetical protein
MSFVRPDVEGLLGKVTSIGLTSGETEAEPVKDLDNKVSLIFQTPGRRTYRHHPIYMRVVRRTFVPAAREKMVTTTPACP